MATVEKTASEVHPCRFLLEGMAKNLVDRLYGPAGLPWGVSFAELEGLAGQLAQCLRQRFLHLALARQADTFRAAPDPAVCRCPSCQRDTDEADPEPRIVHSRAGDAEWIEWVWQGKVGRLIEKLTEWQSQHGVPEKGESPSSVRSVVARTRRYLENNRSRMNYATYRRRGLPIVSSLVESMVKQISRRVKGTEKFWTDDGAEAILQLRADYLSDGGVMEQFWQRRQDAATGQRAYRPRH
jgi:hypothetical protein